MSQETRYEFETLDAREILESPELPEIIETLLKLYREKCRSEEEYLQRIDALLKRIYGQKSEKSRYSEGQMLLFPELLEEQADEGPGNDASDDEVEDTSDTCDVDPDEADNASKNGKRKRKGGHGRSKLPQHLERRVVERVDVDDPKCGECGKERPIIRVEQSERLNYIPAKVIVDVTEVVIRGPLSCECDAEAPKLLRPELPSRPIDRGMPGVDLLNSIVIGKYLYHLPHYRQATKTLKDAGIILSKQTLWDWTRKTAELLEPLWELMHRRQLEVAYLAADETTANMVKKGEPGRRAKTTYLWQYYGFDDGPAPYTVFRFALSRKRAEPQSYLDGFEGTLLTDGYSAYASLPDVILANCMAHARRKFDEAASSSPVIAAQVIVLIGKLYQIERDCASLDAESRRAVRQEKSAPILLRLRLYIEEKQKNVTPQSPIGKAIAYMLNLWEGLCRFVDDGHLPIDNNAVEREMKAIATGRKNWLFFGSERGGRAAAIIYSIIASARRHDLDVWQYLGDILRRLADLKPGELPALLPDAWKRARLAAAA
jgi:transposase